MLKFDDQFRAAMLDGSKIMTARKRQKAAPGDIFPAFGQRFLVIHASREWCDWIIDNHRFFGQPTEQACGDYLRGYLGKDYRPRKLLWVYIFGALPAQEEGP